MGLSPLQRPPVILLKRVKRTDVKRVSTRCGNDGRREHKQRYRGSDLESAHSSRNDDGLDDDLDDVVRAADEPGRDVDPSVRCSTACCPRIDDADDDEACEPVGTERPYDSSHCSCCGCGRTRLVGRRLAKVSEACGRRARLGQGPAAHRLLPGPSLCLVTVERRREAGREDRGSRRLVELLGGLGRSVLRLPHLAPRVVHLHSTLLTPSATCRLGSEEQTKDERRTWPSCS